MKAFILMTLLALFIFTQSFFSTAAPSSGGVTYPIFDAPGQTLPRNLRTVQQVYIGKFSPNLEGLERLKASGSGQFSEETFIKLVERLELTNSHHLVIFDLRQESHGLINGLPVCWTDGLHKYGNIDKTRQEIEMDEYQRLRLANQAGCLVIDPRNEPTKLAVNTVQTERELVEEKGHRYIRLPVTDHNRPSDQVVDEFIQIIGCLSSDEWLHFHCRAGKGRTTTFLTLLDMMMNAQQVSLEDILARQQLIGGADLNSSGSKEGELKRAAEERLDFLKEFYVYCRQAPDFEISWSEWVKHSSILASQP